MERWSPRWDEEAMLKRELAKLHTGEESGVKKKDGWPVGYKMEIPRMTNRQLGVVS